MRPGEKRKKLGSDFVENLKFMLDVTKTTHRELAMYIGTDQSMITRYTTGKSEPSVERMVRIVEFFSKKTEDFIFLDEFVGREIPNEVLTKKAGEISFKKMVGDEDIEKFDKETIKRIMTLMPAIKEIAGLFEKLKMTSLLEKENKDGPNNT